MDVKAGQSASCTVGISIIYASHGLQLNELTCMFSKSGLADVCREGEVTQFSTREGEQTYSRCQVAAEPSAVGSGLTPFRPVSPAIVPARNAYGRWWTDGREHLHVRLSCVFSFSPADLLSRTQVSRQSC
jgi:hypothetical protein